MTGPLQVPLESIPTCFEGTIPSAICTVGADGAPNVTHLSVVHRIDERHVALSRQFFKKTEENTSINPLAQVEVMEPGTGRTFLLDLRYDHTETAGDLFERMRTRLDAVAAFEGMSNVFHLRGVDVCEVLECTALPCEFPAAEPVRGVSLERLELFSQHLAGAEDMEEVLSRTLDACAELLDCRHAYVMLADETALRLYTVASAGFPASGAGSEIAIGTGIVGLAAQRRQTIRVTNLARDLGHAHAARSGLTDATGGDDTIPLPSLPERQSQLVTPMLASRQLVGVLALESQSAGAFQAADECLAGIMASQVAMAIAALGNSMATSAAASPGTELRPIQVKYYEDDESVFLDNEYLIKGVAGGILWRLLRIHEQEHRVDFSNREMRLDATLGLPDVKDNLEARLILLRRRLEERCDYLRIEKTGRGRFRLEVTRPLELIAVHSGAPSR